MDRAGVLALFDFTYWANRHLLEVAEGLTSTEWAASTDITTRGLRATLVHALDVESSWRLRLQERPKADWGAEAELQASDYPTPRSLAEHWSRDEAEMRAWLDTLDQATLDAPWSDGGKDDFPLWYFLVHIVTHSQQQRSDAAVLLSRAGHSPGNIEFLDYADAVATRS